MPAAPAVSARVPAPLTPLISRDGRVDTAWRTLQGTRLLTLTGPGGSGKTRLAVELASRAESAAWVELAALTDPRFVAEHVAATLGISDRSGKQPLAQIVERYAADALLLMLDNCEHLVEAMAAFVGALLRGCPAVRVLATSREPLGVAGERTLVVPPLSLPNDDSLDSAARADAVALFVERAQDVRAGFELTQRNAPAITRICRRLDGIPLAIELAAARVRALDPEQLAERLESSIGLLETGSRAALPRHRTIRETLDWSYRLLSDDERTLLNRLSVFMGTFSLDAVEAVCAERGQSANTVLDRVTALVDKSLLACEPGDAGTRYRQLETVREYAAEHLAAAGETDGIRDRHARFFVGLAERAAPAIFGGVGDEAWMSRLEEEAVNFHEAFDWCEQQSSRLELALRLAVALHWYWYARGRFNEGRLRIGVALTFAEDVNPVLRGRALTALGRIALWQGDYSNVHAPMEEAVQLLRRVGDHASFAYALQGLAIAAAIQNRMGEARRLTEEAASCIAGDPPGVLLVWIEYWRGLIEEWDGGGDAAVATYEHAVGTARRIGHRAAIGHSLTVLGRYSAASGRLDAAERALREAIAIFRDIEDRWGLSFALQGLARSAAESGHGDHAGALLGASDRIREELGIDLVARVEAFHGATKTKAFEQTTEAAFWRAWSEGKQRDLSELLSASPAATGTTPKSDPAADSTPALRICTLGGFDVFVRGRRIEKSQWGSCRARELLAFLACHPTGCTKAQIGLALWPDAAPSQLRNIFHVTLHRLRHALTLPDAIQVDGDRYLLNPSLAREFDAELFEREVRESTRELRKGSNDRAAGLETAVARYRGDFLSGETVGEWAEERRDRLRDLYREALDVLGRAHMEQKRYVEAADVFRAILELDPVNEEACRRQMTCLVQLGDRAAALRAYDSLVRSLRDELGVRPERETSALRDKLVSAT